MRDNQGIKDLFENDKQAVFDFSQIPQLITRRETASHKAFKPEDVTRWSKAQRSFLNWAKDKKVFTKEYIEGGKVAYDSLFNKRGPLKGSILDIGGGWGLYRQWWIPSKSDVFIVHDPGVERYLGGPHKLHLSFYQRAFSLPMSFVEGFGEDLPYKDGIFDTCLIAATLDHCMNPEKVLKEAYRCLKFGGTILVIQYCHLPQPKGRQLDIFRRLLRHFTRSRHLLTILYNRLFHQDHHLQHFVPDDITLLLAGVGFKKIRTDIVPPMKNVYAFEAIKNPDQIA